MIDAQVVQKCGMIAGRCTGGVWLEAGTWGRVPSATLRHALVFVPRQWRPDLLHDNDHPRYDHGVCFFIILLLIFTHTTLASTGISFHRVCPSVMSWCSTEMAKRRIMQTAPHDSPGTLVFWCQNSNGVTSSGGTRCRWCTFSAGEVAEN